MVWEMQNASVATHSHAEARLEAAIHHFDSTAVGLRSMRVKGL
jgi:hypothetical protein